MIDLEEIKRKTMELLGDDDPECVSHIDEDMVRRDAALADDDNDDEGGTEKDASRPIYGHNMRYSNRRDNNGRNRQTYVYERGPSKHSSSDGCKSNHTKWLYTDNWNHSKVSYCNRPDAKLRFTKR